MTHRTQETQTRIRSVGPGSGGSRIAEEPRALGEARARAGAQGDGQLLPQEQVLYQEGVAAAEQHAQGAEQEPEPFQHGGSMPHLHLAVLTDELPASYRHRVRLSP